MPASSPVPRPIEACKRTGGRYSAGSTFRTEPPACQFSLTLYVKGMRTPWVLGGLEADAAYVGLSFSIDRSAEKGKHVVLGCSHI